MTDRVNSIVLERLILRVMGGTADARVRSYRPSMTGDVIDDYRNQITDTGSYQLGRLASRLTTYSTELGDTIVIPEGWDGKRCIFMMVVKVVTDHATQIFHIQGYTDQPGVVSGVRSGFRNSSLDPEMVFYINSINKSVQQTQVRRDRRTGSSVEVPCSIRTGTSMYLLDHGYEKKSDRRSSGRPVKRGITARSILSHLDLEGPDEEDWIKQTANLRANTFDTSTVVSRKPQLVSRNSNIAGKMISEVVNTYIPSLDDLDQNMVMETPSASAINRLVQSEDWTHNVFMDILGSSNNYARKNGSFTWKDLLKVCGDADRYVEIAEPEPTRIYDDNNNLYGSTTEALTASKLFAEIPTLMMEKYLSGVKFRAELINGMDIVVIEAYVFMDDNVTRSRVLENLTDELERDIFYSISGPNRVYYQIDGYISVLGKSTVNISIDGGRSCRYEHYTACSGLTSPCITDRESDLKHMSDTVESIVRIARDMTDDRDFRRRQQTSLRSSIMGEDIDNEYEPEYPEQYHDDDNREPSRDEERYLDSIDEEDCV